MDNWPGWSTRFQLLFRQEQSRHASGRTRVKDFGTPIWQTTFQSRSLRPNLLDEWRARLGALQNGLVPFRVWPLSRCWPQLHPNGVGAVPGEVGTIGVDNRSLSILWLGGTTNLSVGDYIEVNGRWLHQITNVADGPVYSVIPHFSVGALSGQTVSVASPGVDMTLDPNSVQTTSGLNGRANISFTATEARG